MSHLVRLGLMAFKISTQGSIHNSFHFRNVRLQRINTIIFSKSISWDASKAITPTKFLPLLDKIQVFDLRALHRLYT